MCVQPAPFSSLSSQPLKTFSSLSFFHTSLDHWWLILFLRKIFYLLILERGEGGRKRGRETLI